MTTVVITGSTRGIGYGLANVFLSKGCQVSVSGRTAAAVDKAVARLSAKHPAAALFGFPCDVTQLDQVQALWDAARTHWGRIDIWINNAGVGQRQNAIWELSAEQLRAIVETNVLGTLHGCKVAALGMRAQGGGAIYNMEGLGSDGRHQDGLDVYGASKYAVKYITDSLVLETRGTAIIAGALQPGMVLTEMITGQYEGRQEEWEKAQKVFSILADQAETVTPWLVDKVLANTRTGARIRWLTPAKVMRRFLMARLRGG
jgi:NAD(P)-dependent dehydrogenase (short-subunit alcohol dehydrogenase family)